MTAFRNSGEMLPARSQRENDGPNGNALDTRLGETSYFASFEKLTCPGYGARGSIRSGVTGQRSQQGSARPKQRHGQARSNGKAGSNGQARSNGKASANKKARSNDRASFQKAARAEPNHVERDQNACDIRPLDPIHRYRDMTAYRAAVGRDFPRDRVIDTRDFRGEMAVVDLRTQQPTVAEFLRLVRRELKLRNYKKRTQKPYLCAVASLLRWSGRLPHEVDRETVKQYLLYLVDSEKGFSEVSVHSSAIRTVFDKFCFLDVTLGLETPKRDKKQPVVLSQDEVRKLLQAAVTLRDKLLLGLMYATGMRVSEVVEVRWRDIDLDRNMIAVVQGKGNVDRKVALPETYRSLFASLKASFGGETFLFPGEANHRRRSSASRYLSTRTVQRVMKRAVQIAGIDKLATPHSLRHSFATHSFENGCDIRRIQKVLGHVRLETTTIYVHLAKPSDPTKMPSPLDSLSSAQAGWHLTNEPDNSAEGSGRKSTRSDANQGPVIDDRVKIHVKQFEGEADQRVTLQMRGRTGTVFLTGIRAKQPRVGLFTLELPPLEQWRDDIGKLASTDQKLVQQSEFYDYLRRNLTSRLIGPTRHAALNDRTRLNRVSSTSNQRSRERLPSRLPTALKRSGPGERRRQAG